MKWRRIILILLNIAFIAAFWPLTREEAGVENVPAPKATVAPLTYPQIYPQRSGLARPLFRAASLPATSRTAPQDSPPPVRLVGVILTEEGEIGLVEHDGGVLRVGTGDDLAGWRVARIAARTIRLEQAGKSVDLPLDKPADDAR